MIQKTRNYDKFVFRADNREKIDRSHVNKLVASIKSRNMLEIRPICVNSKMEILDGQHRVLAAKELGVDVYYTIENSLDTPDMLLLNTAKAWTDSDYLNYYIQNEYEEYEKLKQFIDRNKIQLKVALSLTMGSAHEKHNGFRRGGYIFESESFQEKIELCRETIDYIKQMNGHSPYTRSSRFWKAMIKVFIHPEFNEGKWKASLTRMTNRITNKATIEDYIETFLYIYNYKNKEKIIMEE